VTGHGTDERVDGEHRPAERTPHQAGCETVDQADDTQEVSPRHRPHRFPGRSRALKVLYDEAEFASVQAAASAVGLTPTGYVAAAGLSLASSGSRAGAAAAMPGSALDRAALSLLLRELLEVRTALRRYAVNVNQAVAALNSGAGAPVWLAQAVAGCDRAVRRVDDVTLQLSRRLR